MSQSMQKKRVVIMAGGTGGHVFPGLAVAKALRAQNCDVAWLGTERGIEARLVPAEGLPIHFLNIKGVRGRGIVELAKAPIRILGAIGDVRRWFAEFKPNLVVGLGGYAAGPGGIAAWTMGIPLIIHEQNARAGTTNKILRRFAKRVLVAFDGALPKAQCIGNPVRSEISNIVKHPKNDANTAINILVLGGSLGAKAINEIVPKAIAQINPTARPYVKHQTGEKHLQETKDNYTAAGVNAEILAFIDDMAQALAWADLVICRAGALTVAEVSAAGVASVLVPFPFAIDDHQTANAQWLVDQKAAFLRQQKDLTPESLSELVQLLMNDRGQLSAMGKAARACAKNDATQAFSSICLEVANG